MYIGRNSHGFSNNILSHPIFIKNNNKYFNGYGSIELEILPAEISYIEDLVSVKDIENGDTDTNDIKAIIK